MNTFTTLFAAFAMSLATMTSGFAGQTTTPAITAIDASADEFAVLHSQGPLPEELILHKGEALLILQPFGEWTSTTAVEVDANGQTQTQTRSLSMRFPAVIEDGGRRYEVLTGYEFHPSEDLHIHLYAPRGGVKTYLKITYTKTGKTTESTVLIIVK